jgi:DNA-binding XRE family transcriptional regulator
MKKGGLLRKRRLELALDAKELSQKTGLCPNTIYNLEKGKYTYYLIRYCRLLKELELSPEEVFADLALSE